MARTWLEVEVVLVGVADDERRDPGRVFVVGPSHSFGQLAGPINAAFRRWDLSYLHEFELGGGRKIRVPDDEFAPEVVWEDQAQIKVASAVAPGQKFSFTFDLGEGWLHRCRVMAQKIKPREYVGEGRCPSCRSGASGPCTGRALVADITYLRTWGLGIPRRRQRRLQPADRRLEHGRPHARRASRRPGDGSAPPPARVRPDVPLRPGKPARTQRVVATPGYWSANRSGRDSA